MAELADLSLFIYPSAEGLTACHAVVLTISNRKTNKFGRKQFIGAMRHKSPYLCCLGALA